MSAKILVIEDDRAISELICMNLEAAGYLPFPMLDGTRAERFLMTKEAQEMALALLDIMLPGKDGFALMEDLKRVSIPVICLTAKDDVISKVHGLKAGAEDYIVKPFEVLELLVRIEKVLKRTGRGRDKLTIRDVVIDLKEHSVTRQGRKVALKPLEYELLVTLASSRNVALSREELLIGMYDNDSIHKQETDMMQLFQEAAELEKHYVQSQHIKLEISCEMDHCEVDRDLMVSLLVNLIDNAIHASREGDVIYLIGKDNVITVRDTGTGIPEDDIDRITEAFYTVDKARSRKEGGSGLGLFLCSMIAKLHGAMLQIESRMGEGTEVSLTLP